MALGLQIRLEGDVVLDDAVVDHHDIALAVGVRMGIVLGGLTVGRPACVPDADLAIERALGEDGLEVLQLADRAAGLDPDAVQHRDPGRVVAAVFETTKALENDGAGLTGADVADDATHGVCPSFSSWAWLCQ